MRLMWRDLAVDDTTLSALNALAGDTPYVGHSASLTRCHFSVSGALTPAVPAARRVYPGRLIELERDFRAGRRPGPGEDTSLPAEVPRRAPRGQFASRWLVLEHIAGDVLDLRATALLSKALRAALMSGFRRILGEASIPEIVSGHLLDGRPTAQAHLAIVPLAFIDRAFGDGSVLGVALVPPGDGALLDDAAFQAALGEVAPWNEAAGRRELRLWRSAIEVVLTPNLESARRSLDPAPYVATARTWATCTPMVLGRHLKEKSNAAREFETQELIAQACHHSGLPAPDVVVPDKHSAITGAPSARPSRRSPAWMGWRLPDNLASRPLTHAILQFAEPVRGPVILGAGRFAGLGLCRPHNPQKI
jgi:CRISPR-associated protein Csb2